MDLKPSNSVFNFTFHAVHGEVACEHTSFDAEDLNGVPHYRTVTFDTPAHASLTDFGYLEPDVRARSKLFTHGPPRLQAFDAPVRGQARMVHDNRHAGKSRASSTTSVKCHQGA